MSRLYAIIKILFAKKFMIATFEKETLHLETNFEPQKDFTKSGNSIYFHA